MLRLFDHASKRPPGDVPWGFYWFVPGVTALVLFAMVLVLFALPLPLAESDRVIVIGSSAVVVIAAAGFQMLRPRQWDFEAQRLRLNVLESLTELIGVMANDTE